VYAQVRPNIRFSPEATTLNDKMQPLTYKSSAPRATYHSGSAIASERAKALAASASDAFSARRS
jgi:hypothetical protein